MRLLAFACLSWSALVHAYTGLSDDALRGIPGPGNDFDIDTGAILAPILIPRVPGTPGSTKVLNHFRDFWRDQLPLWDVTVHNFTDATPLEKEVKFHNFIASRDPPWAQPGDVGRLTLVAHYDSLSTPKGFIGAIDSAAPCAMIMHAVRSIDEALTRKWTKMQEDGIGDDGLADSEDNRGIQVIFLDGEEAFVHWTATDSIYGARALAHEWENTEHSMMAAFQSPLQSIELFVLLDLLGHVDTQVPSYYKTTHWAYKKLAAVEGRLRGLDLLASNPTGGVFLHEAEKHDSDRWLGGYIGDDHTPFMARGVDVMHLIPSHFPPVWHKMSDNGQNLDTDTVADWAKLVAAFAAEWMDLEGFMTDATTVQHKSVFAKDGNLVKDEL